MNAIHKLRFQHNLKLLCKVLKVNRSTYYKHFSANPAPRIRENQQIKRIILQIYAKFDNAIGAYNIATVLERDYGIHISVGRVYRLMLQMQLPKPSTSKPKRPKHVDNEDACTNHLKQNFQQTTPNLVWASDFTYIKVNGKFYYLCVVMDLFSRKIIGWHLAGNHNADLVISAFNKALKSRKPQYGLMFHSDQGAEYTSKVFRKLLDEHNIVQSFSKKGYPYDNACCESFFKYLKKRLVNRKSYFTQKELYLDLFDYIENKYNNRYPHSALNSKTPNEFENQYWQTHSK